MVGGESISTNEPGCEIGRTVVSRDEIARRVAQLAREIADLYRGRELTILPVLTGAFIFAADLIRAMPLVMRIDLVSISSYPGKAVESLGPRFEIPIPADLAGRDILIVDDILDSGRTLASLFAAVRAQSPASVRACVLVRKRRAAGPPCAEADFVGFDVPDEFVVGYGMDFDHRWRNLPDICVLDERAKGGAP